MINLKLTIFNALATFLISSPAVEQMSDVKNEAIQPFLIAGREPLDCLWEGFYLKKSELCTSPINGSDCSEKFYDYLKIERVQQGYRVGLHSTQAYQNVCSFDFIMNLTDGKLVYKTKFGTVSLQRNSESVKISSRGLDLTALGIGVCGIHADIDGLTFPLLSHSTELKKN